MRARQAGISAALAVALAATGVFAADLPPATFNHEPMLPDGPARQVSPHAWAIEGFPNVIIVVGDKATLVVDTGLGPRNGAIVAREAQRLSTKGQKLYLTTTHFHAEHVAGDAAFPPGTVLIRAKVQEAELATDGPAAIARSAGQNEVRKQLLAGVKPRAADVLFDRDYVLDLGGLTARLMYRGPAHTRGDEEVFIDGDRVLIPGDVLQDRIVPNAACAECSPKTWLSVIDQMAPLQPKIILSDHGNFGDGSMIARQRGFLADLQARAMALKAQGKSADEAGKTIAAEFATKYAGWVNLETVPALVAKAYADPT